MSDTYNGWTNFETWVVKLWMDNDEGSYRWALEQTTNAWAEAELDDDHGLTAWAARRKQGQDARNILESILEDEHEEHRPEVTGVYADLLTHSLGRVDWREIADAMIKDAAESGCLD